MKFRIASKGGQFGRQEHKRRSQLGELIYFDWALVPYMTDSRSSIALMAAITPEQARDYLDRWKQVEKVEADALRDTPLEIKVRQLAVLMASRHLFAGDREREKSIDLVRERWRKIRGALHAGHRGIA